MKRHSVGSDGGERLARLPLFEGVPGGQCKAVAGLIDEFEADAGEMLMDDSQGFEVMLLEQGTAEVWQGGQQINTMRPGDMFGELAVLGDGLKRSAVVRAAEPVRGLLFTANFIRQVHDRVPLVGQRMDAIAKERLENDAARAAGS